MKRSKAPSQIAKKKEIEVESTSSDQKSEEPTLAPPSKKFKPFKSPLSNTTATASLSTTTINDNNPASSENKNISGHTSPAYYNILFAPALKKKKVYKEGTLIVRERKCIIQYLNGKPIYDEYHSCGALKEGDEVQISDWLIEIVNEMGEEEFSIENKARLRPTSKKDITVVTKPIIQSDNVGNKLMKMMGWKGAGLGKNEEGAVEPIAIVIKQSNFGLGYIPPVSYVCD